MSLKSGYRFKNFEGSGEPLIRALPVPERVVIGSDKEDNNSFTARVAVGDSVRAGEPVAASLGTPPGIIVSPVNGTVVATDDGIVIEPDGSASFEPVPGHIREPWNLERSELYERFCSTGCIHLLPDTLSSTGAADTEKVGSLIISAVFNSPLDQAWTPLMYGDQKLCADGLRTLKALFPAARITIAVNKRNRKHLDNPDIMGITEIQTVSDLYPQGHHGILARDIAGKSLVSPEGETNPSIVVISFTDLIQIAEVMTRGRPLIDRIVLVAGPGVSQPGWYRIRLGTPFGEFFRLFKWAYEGPWRIIRGDVMTGKGLDSLDAAVSYDDSIIAVIAEKTERELFRFMMPGFAADSYARVSVSNYLSLVPKKLGTGLQGGVRPCVQCNYCDEVCPVGIYPFLIWKHVEAGEAEESFRLRPYDCIECGLCDYVCPSKISVSAAVVKATGEYRKMRRGDEGAH